MSVEHYTAMDSEWWGLLLLCLMAGLVAGCVTLYFAIQVIKQASKRIRK